jgi:hypothetical protein
VAHNARLFSRKRRLWRSGPPRVHSVRRLCKSGVDACQGKSCKSPLGPSFVVMDASFSIMFARLEGLAHIGSRHMTPTRPNPWRSPDIPFRCRSVIRYEDCGQMPEPWRLDPPEPDRRHNVGRHRLDTGRRNSGAGTDRREMMPALLESYRNAGHLSATATGPPTKRPYFPPLVKANRAQAIWLFPISFNNFSAVTLSGGTNSPATYFFKASDRRNLPEEVRGKVPGGSSSM